MIIYTVPKKLNIILNGMNKEIIAITIGDINGIGIEILIKLFIPKFIYMYLLQMNHLLNQDLKTEPF